MLLKMLFVPVSVEYLLPPCCLSNVLVADRKKSHEMISVDIAVVRKPKTQKQKRRMRQLYPSRFRFMWLLRRERGTCI